jgi:hypothetical protein
MLRRLTGSLCSLASPVGREIFVLSGVALPCFIRKVMGEGSIGCVFLPEASQFSLEQRKAPVLRP